MKADIPSGNIPLIERTFNSAKKKMNFKGSYLFYGINQHVFDGCYL